MVLQLLLEYPPAKISLSAAPTLSSGAWSGEAINVWTASITGQAYGSGSYVIKSSSLNGVNAQWSLFDSRPDTEAGAQWASANYNNGAWAGGVWGKYTLDGSYYGDWLSIQLPEPMPLIYTTFLARSGFQARAPSQFRIYCSLDGVDYAVVHSQTTALAYINGEASISIANPPFCLHIVLVVSALSGSETYLNFNGWKLFGEVRILIFLLNCCVYLPITHVCNVYTVFVCTL
jgi:hypothetical protein